jgi:dipeptidyl-peptidase 4
MRGLAVSIASITLLLFSAAAHAQGSRGDYERAAAIAQRVQGKVLNARIAPVWLEEGQRLWYRLDQPGGGRRWLLADASTGEVSPLFDHEALAAALTRTLGREITPSHLPIERLIVEGDRLYLLVSGELTAWTTDRAISAIEASPEARSRFATVRQAGEARSRRTGQESAIIFFNRSGGSITLHWRDSEGNSRQYGDIAAGQERRQHTYEGHVWEVRADDGRRLGLYEAEPEPTMILIGDPQPPASDAAPHRRREQRRPAATSPDGRWEILFRSHNAAIRDSTSGDEISLTTDGREEVDYRGAAIWSPDSRYIALRRHKRGGDRKVHYVESSPRNTLQPILRSYDYLKPGDPISQDRPVIFESHSGREITVGDHLFDNPWSISNEHWSPDGAEFRFLYNQRGHQALRLLGISTAGDIRTIIDESSPTFIDYSQKTFLHRLEATDELIWASERDGWNHLYLYDAAAGTLKNQITRGQWVVRGVDRVDAEARQIWFRAGGIIPDQDPYHIHYCRVNFDGSGLTILTSGDGTHTVQFAPDRRTFTATWSRVDHPPVTELRRSSDGGLIATLVEADWSALLKTGWKPPQRFIARGRDGATDIWGVIWRPTNFDPSKKYPIIENIYAGPHSAHVPKEFRGHHGQQELAELGFIVVMIDGMGTNHRGKAFHDVAWKNIADAGFPDRILWIRAAAEAEPAMDITRVGIYGGSAGGQNAMRALLDHGDFYSAAVADCGCHDNRMDKIWWNEAWMGWPVDESYERSSNVVDAHKLRGKLFLIVGETDTNVDPASTMQVVDALIRADKDFDLLVVPGVGHGALSSPYARRRFQDFFVRNLWNCEPRHAD